MSRVSQIGHTRMQFTRDARSGAVSAVATQARISGATVSISS
jgi:hypothetical protein